MKKSTKPFSLVIILLIAFALASCQDKKALTYVPVSGKKYIVLLVNTADIIRPGANPKDFSSFPDQHGVSDSLYTTLVFPGDSVIWIGVSTSSVEDKVDIEMINHRGHPNNILGPGPTQGVNGRVKGKIKDTAKIHQKETYAIHFRVNNQPRIYILDPILRVH